MDKRAMDEAFALYERLTADGRPAVSSLGQAYCLQRMIEEAHRIFEHADRRGAQQLFTDPEVRGLFLTAQEKLASLQSLVGVFVQHREEDRPRLASDA